MDESHSKKRRGSFAFSQSISASEIQLMEQIGANSIQKPQFGLVYRAYCRSQEVAVKKLQRFASDPKFKGDFLREAAAMGTVRHPRIVSLLGICTETEEWMMILEYCPKGDLSSALHNPKFQISLLKKLKWGIQICLGMNWLNGKEIKIQHQDLKPANVLLDKDYNCKIADFGLSVLYKRNHPPSELGIGGSMIWSAPEVLKKSKEVPIDYKAEIYSFSICFWEILVQKTPFSTYKDGTIFIDDVCGPKKVRPKFQDHVPPVLKEICYNCWDEDPSDRPSWIEIIKRLENARLNLFINSNIFYEANLLWKSNWIEFDRVKLDVFLNELMKKTPKGSGEISDEMTKYKKCILAIFNKKLNSSNFNMSLKKLQKMLNWFAGMGVPLATILPHLAMILYQHWFFGSIDGKEAEALLEDKPVGTYLVRFNHGKGQVPTQDAPYTLSRVELTKDNAKRISHTYVQRGELGGLFIQIGNCQVSSSSFSILVLMSKLLTTAEKHFCQEVCPGHPFIHLFSIGSTPNYMPIEMEED